MQSLQAFLAHITLLGADPTDSPEIHLRKSILALGSFLMVFASMIWGGALILLGESLAGVLSLI